MAADWLPLTTVAMVGGRRSLRPVAWRNDELILHDRFVADVARWQCTFAAQAGQRFALSFADGYDFAAALFGAWHAGKQVYLPGDAQPATLSRLAPIVDGWAGDHPDTLKPSDDRSDDLFRQPLDLQQTSLVIYTSGTNGEPLAITKKLSQLDAEVHALQEAFGAVLDANPPPAVYSTVSQQHIYGLLFFILWPLAAGRPFVAQRLVYPEQMASQLGGRCTVLVSSPAHLGRIPQGLDWEAARAGLRAVFSSGGPLSVEAAAACLDLMAQSPREVYGSSETGGIAWRQRAFHGDHWQALPGIEWRIDNESLEVRSRHLDTADWWQTSDRVVQDDAGGFVLLGRADRIVKVEEKRVSLTAIELALSQSADIAEARVFMLATSTGPKLAIVAVPTTAGWASLQSMGKRAFSEGLRESLLDVVERVALPRRWRYARALPVNSQGKSTEALLAALFRPTKPITQWLRRDAEEAHAVLAVTPDLAVFDGHFDAQAVLPGVAQLGWAVQLARDCFALPPRFLCVDALKFQRPVLPPADLQLSLVLRRELAQVSFRFASEAGLHSSGRLLFGDT